ncbi:PaaI family thioesterase [Streptomyces sp. M10(2022)]
MWAGEGVTRHDPVTGPENALAPPLTLHGRDDGSIEGTVTLGLPYQGPPGHVHGGISALLLDHTLGVANHWGGPSGMTAELTLRYLRPTPLFEPLTVTGRQISVDGSRIRTVGVISAGGRECEGGRPVHRQAPSPPGPVAGRWGTCRTTERERATAAARRTPRMSEPPRTGGPVSE